MPVVAAFSVASLITLGLATSVATYQATMRGRVGDIVLHLGASLSLLFLATWCLIKGTGVALSLGGVEVLIGLVAIALLSEG